MKCGLTISFLLLAAISCVSQTAITDSIHPLFRGKLDGNKIREQFDNFEPAFPTEKIKGKYNEVIMSMFHSKKLYLNTAPGEQEKLSELAPFKLNLKKDGRFAMMGGIPFSSAVPLFDSIPVVVTAYGINNENKSQYRYRVLKNEKEEIIGWKEPYLFSPVMVYFRYNGDGTEQQQMAYLGAFSAPVGNSLTIEVKNLFVPDTVYKISAVWIKRSPVVIGTYSAGNLKDLISVSKFQWKNDPGKLNKATYYGNIELKPVDSLLKIDSLFSHQQNDLFLYIKDRIQSAELVEYNLVKGKDSAGWKVNSFDPNILWLQDLTPGHYHLVLRYAFQRQSTSVFSFTVMPAWYQTIWFKLIAGILMLSAILSVYLLFRNKRQKKQLRDQQVRQELAQAEIKSLKSQFNPHFVFNALSSIQGLITKNEIEAAHLYLNDFSTLLRNSLKESEHEYISLSKDVALVENYVKLEQLRFGFQYEIHIDESINQDAIEVPVLLLQPVIENAIKHGIARLYNKGRITISYTLQDADLLVAVRDNGDSYQPALAASPNGHGLKLTSERVKLINKTLKGQSVHWEINSRNQHTEALFIFKNWGI